MFFPFWVRVPWSTQHGTGCAHRLWERTWCAGTSWVLGPCRFHRRWWCGCFQAPPICGIEARTHLHDGHDGFLGCSSWQFMRVHGSSWEFIGCLITVFVPFWSNLRDVNFISLQQNYFNMSMSVSTVVIRVSCCSCFPRIHHPRDHRQAVRNLGLWQQETISIMQMLGLSEVRFIKRLVSTRLNNTHVSIL